MKDICSSLHTHCFRQGFFEATSSNCPPQLRGTVKAASSVVRSKAETGGIATNISPKHAQFQEQPGLNNPNNFLQPFTKQKQLYTTHDLTSITDY